MHISVPSEHSPTSVMPHEPMFVRPSSNSMSQSSSRPLHDSGPPPIAPMQTTVPLSHEVTPATHSPASVPHDAPPPGLPSSIMPLQLLSLRSQVSARGSFVQLTVPATHCFTAPWHSPTWLGHASPISGNGASSTLPSQSLSLSSQTSSPGTHGGPSGPPSPGPPSLPLPPPSPPTGQPMQ
jgi:hypothetical protein